MAAAVCLMLLLPDELLTKIIIHSIKDVAVFQFLNLRNKICGTFRRICNSDEVLLHVSLHDLREALLTVQNRAQVHRKATGDLVPFSPRRVLPRFVNPRIGSKLLGFSI
jgi:hypothetical protein